MFHPHPLPLQCSTHWLPPTCAFLCLRTLSGPLWPDVGMQKSSCPPGSSPQPTADGRWWINTPAPSPVGWDEGGFPQWKGAPGTRNSVGVLVLPQRPPRATSSSSELGALKPAGRGAQECAAHIRAVLARAGTYLSLAHRLLCPSLASPLSPAFLAWLHSLLPSLYSPSLEFAQETSGSQGWSLVVPKRR